MADPGKLLGLIADEDTVVGFLMGGIGEIKNVTKKIREPNYMIVHKFTPVIEIEECFNKFVKRPDIDIILIQQNVAELIRFAIDSITTVLPTILEIPSKDSPYDANKDSILNRARGLFNPQNLSLEDA